MVRGTIVSLAPVPLLPTFAYACTYVPTFLRLYARHLETLGFGLPCDEAGGAYQRFTGDASVLDEAAPFIAMPPLKPDQHEVYDLPAVADARMRVALPSPQRPRGARTD